MLDRKYIVDRRSFGVYKIFDSPFRIMVNYLCDRGQTRTFNIASKWEYEGGDKGM
jgi:hypothetical protein